MSHHIAWTWFVIGLLVGWYITPGVVAFYHWMCVRRDVLHNDAKMAWRERR